MTSETEAAPADGRADLAAVARMLCVLASRVTGRDHPRLAIDALASVPGYQPQGAADVERIARLAGLDAVPEQVRLPPRVRPVVLDAGEPRARPKNATTYTAEPGRNDRMRAEARQAEAQYRNGADVSLQASNRYLSPEAIDMRRRNGMEVPEPRPMYPEHTAQQVSAGTEQP